MLSPEQISNIGNSAVRITQQEIDALVSMVSGEIAAAIKRGDSYKSLLNKSLDVEQQALRELLRSDSELRDAAVRTVVDALSEQLDDDLERIGIALADLPPEILAAMHQSTAATAQGVREIVRRENLAMADNVRQGFFTVSSKYIAMVNAGGIKTEDAVKRAVLELADKGIDTVQYKSGAKAQADVAIRRHLASQVTQVGGKRVMQIMNALDVELVEVSSHIGARPSHAEWQGKCYSMHGRVVRDGVVYEDFGLATGYFGQGPNGALGDRLQGVNCRHFFGPYLHGQPRTYSETPDEDAGYERGEVYKNTQKQRAYEREIRRTKRRIAALEGAGLKDTPEHTIERIKLGDLQRALKKHVDAHEYLTRRYGRERVSELMIRPRALTKSRELSKTPGAAREGMEQIDNLHASQNFGKIWDNRTTGNASPSILNAQVKYLDSITNRYPMIRDSIIKYGIEFRVSNIDGIANTHLDKGKWQITFNEGVVSSTRNFSNEVEGSIKSGFLMPAGKYGIKHYPVAHELGHIYLKAIVEHEIGEHYSSEDLNQLADYCKREIENIVQSLPGRPSKIISRYSRDNSREFFAECFANLECGKVNAYGFALKQFLKEEGYLC